MSVDSIGLKTVLAALDGTTPAPAHPAVRIKTMKLMPDGPADLLILEDVFAIRYDRGLGGRYILSVAPAIVHALMRRAGVASVKTSLVTKLVAKASSDGHSEQPDQTIWILRSADGVDIRIRNSTPERQAPHTPTTIPADGSLALPEVLWRSPYLTAFRHFPAPVTCRHCLAASTRFHQLNDALKCEKCGLRFSSRIEQPK